jgi:phage recombination protein Bet
MSKELAVVDFNEEQIKLIKTQIAPKATNDELQLFLYQAKRTGLDPLTRQIYAIHRNCKEIEFGKEVWKEKMSIQTSIDGFRVVAERSGSYGGQDEPVFNEVDGKIISCKVTVYRFRGDVRYPAAVGLAYWDEYVQTNKYGPSPMWKKMPHTMISKVAEALALRKAYPQDLSGLYTSDEMNQVDNVKPEVVVSDSDATNDKPESNIKRLAKVSGAETKESFEKENKDLAERLITKIKGMGSCSELQGWMEEKVVISAYNKLEKYSEYDFNRVRKADLAKLAELDPEPELS